MRRLPVEFAAEPKRIHLKGSHNQGVCLLHGKLQFTDADKLWPAETEGAVGVTGLAG